MVNKDWHACTDTHQISPMIFVIVANLTLMPCNHIKLACVPVFKRAACILELCLCSQWQRVEIGKSQFCNCKAGKTFMLAYRFFFNYIFVAGMNPTYWRSHNMRLLQKVAAQKIALLLAQLHQRKKELSPEKLKIGQKQNTELCKLFVWYVYFFTLLLK